VLRWKSGAVYAGRFAFSGAQTYAAPVNASFSSHPLF